MDSPGFNASATASITLLEGPAGTFSFSSGAFFPIDGALLGDQGRSHNRKICGESAGIMTGMRSYVKYLVQAAPEVDARGHPPTSHDIYWTNP